jgi:hypothetical protein
MPATYYICEKPPSRVVSGTFNLKEVFSMADVEAKGVFAGNYMFVFLLFLILILLLLGIN